MDVLRAYVLEVLNETVRDQVAPRFWALMDPSADTHANPRNKDQDEDAPQNGSVAGNKKDLRTWGQTGFRPERRQAYDRVTRALLYVDEVLTGHLNLIRPLDVAIARSGSSTAAVRAATRHSQARPSTRIAANKSACIEEHYRSAFTAQVMAGATGGFHRTMRAFFDLNLRFWHRSWLDERQRTRCQAGRPSSLASNQAIAPSVAKSRQATIRGDGMDVCDPENEEEEQDGVMQDQEAGLGRGTRDNSTTLVSGDEKASFPASDSTLAGDEDDEDDRGGPEDEDEASKGEGGTCGVEGEDEDEDEGDEEEESDEEIGDVTAEELLQLWGVVRRLRWFSLLQETFTGVMSSYILAYVKRRCDAPRYGGQATPEHHWLRRRPLSP